ncbi:MAG: hypothetical protein IJV34_02555 [Prevotella sp.]|nr:hypothetical protein [Prevotella sp.]
MEQELLMQEVERVMGCRLTEAGDFERLAHLLLLHTRERLSPTTLKRLWGYLSREKVATRRHTLDVLSRFVGYRGYEDFCAHVGSLGEVQSGISTEQRITTEQMRLGQRLVITWRPDRQMVVRHLGGSRFEVVEAANTKLCVGDTFRCHLMIQHEPLYLDDLQHQGMPRTAYIAGQRNGVVVEVL